VTLVKEVPRLPIQPGSQVLARWILDDLSENASGWFGWPTGSGDLPLEILREASEGRDVSAWDSLEDLKKEYITTGSFWKQAASPKPRTTLGKRLLELRHIIVASGEPLLDWDQVEREVHERRAERELE